VSALRLDGRSRSSGVKSTMARAPFALYPAWLAVFVVLNPPAAIAQERPTNLAGRTDNQRADVVARLGSARAQHPTPSSTGTLVASAREEGSGRLLPGVSVTVVHHDGKFRLTGTTSEDGVLRVEDAPPGKYSLYFMSGEHLWARSTGVVGAGHTTVVLFHLEPAAAVSGQILSPSGSSRAGAQVELLRLVGSTPYPIFAGVKTAATDNDGRFRLAPLDAGEYYVRVNPDGAPARRHADIYHPGVSEPGGARPVQVEKSQEITLTLTVPLVPLGVVSGRVSGFDRSAGREVQVTVQRLDESGGHVIVQRLVELEPEGSFRVPALQPGRYGLVAKRKTLNTSELREGGVLEIDVGANPEKDATIRLQPVATLRGRFVVWGADTPDLSQMSVSASAVGPGAALRFGFASSAQSEDGSFEITGLLGLHRLIVSTAGQGWIAEAILLEDGTNVIDEPYMFEEGKDYSNVNVVLTDRSATISGRVPIDLHRREGGGTLVVVFPEDESLWESHRLVTHDTPDADGGFRVEGIAPGMVYRVGVRAWSESDGTNLKDLARTAARVYVDRPGAYHVTLASRR
jgi:hypothetical protein